MTAHEYDPFECLSAAQRDAVRTAVAALTVLVRDAESRDSYAVDLIEVIGSTWVDAALTELRGLGLHWQVLTAAVLDAWQERCKRVGGIQAPAPVSARRLGACGVTWPVCPECLGQSLAIYGQQAVCPLCFRQWPRAEVSPCPWPATAILSDARGIVCLSHASHPSARDQGGSLPPCAGAAAAARMQRTEAGLPPE